MWLSPSASDAEKIFIAACASESVSSSDSYANILLYAKKYKISICYESGFLFRKYEASEKINVQIPKTMYAFPLGNGKLKTALDFLKQDANENPLSFFYLTDKQKLLLETKMPNAFEFFEVRDKSDYLYKAEKLATLSGKKMQKKRNHVSQFLRKYNDVLFAPITNENKNDARLVEEQWFLENDGKADDDKKIEKEIIEFALSHFDEFNFHGGILYEKKNPIAMTIGSAISDCAFDIHFEKAVSTYARDGAYAVINQAFSKTLLQYEFINREEDLGIEGLRKAKLSYHPDLLLTKWLAKERSN